MWSESQVAEMFRSGFADAMRVPAMVLMVQGIISLGQRAVASFPDLAATPEGRAKFESAKPLLDVLSR
jgi:hypothetical protein